MYNLIVSGDCDSWNGKTFSLDTSRCLRSAEYTSEDLVTRFGRFTEEAVEQLKTFPCLFAYEESCGRAPRFGWFKNIKRRVDQIVMECEYTAIEPWIDEGDLRSIQSSLDIYGWEMSRTHWALKDVDLAQELIQLGVSIPPKKSIVSPIVNPENHLFDVAFSFPGEERSLVEKVVIELQKQMDPNNIFYDNHFKAFLARPNLDVLLSKIYREQARLIVVFLSGEYQRKHWPGLEFRSVREIIFEKQHNKVMYIRMDDSPVDGVLKTDGYIDARTHSPTEIAGFIFQRVQAHKVADNPK